MTESVDIVSSRSPTRRGGVSSFAVGEIATVRCERCDHSRLPWELRNFSGKAICSDCYQATLDLAQAAIRVMPRDEGRLCSGCRALRDPSLGSAWCPLVELGDERARICNNFVSISVDRARRDVIDGRSTVIDIWRAAAEELHSALGEQSYNAWFGDIEPVDIQGAELVLAVPNSYVRDWLQQRLQPVVRNALAVAGFPHLVPTYSVETDPTRTSPPPDSRAAEKKAGFNPHYTFQEFIVGSGNRLAHASAIAVADKPGHAYNPLVLYGGVGVGKTHLLQAIGQMAIDAGRGEVLYVTSETFTNELILAIRDGSTRSFRDRYRSVDYLLLDDIQFIAGKEATQEEFFHTFNALHQAGKQIVLSSDRPPSELRILEDRLRSRFAWGLTADMQPPDLETRIAIVRSKSEMRGRRLSEDVLNGLASRAGNNVRELEGALNRVLALADLQDIDPSLETVRSILGDREVSGSVHPRDILEAVSAYYRVKTSDLTGQQRERRIAYPRQIAMYLLREEAKLSLVEVGNQLGGRTHTTVMYNCEKVSESRNRGRVKQDLHALRQLIYAVE